MEFGHLGDTLLLIYSLGNASLEISCLASSQSWMLYNSYGAVSTFGVENKFYFQSTPTYFNLSFANDYSVVFDKTNTENADASITASFDGGSGIAYYDAADHDIVLS
jgi:hypothetical protein